ncbi:MAG: hypothetical protein BEU04_01315 [Marine Group III euryarchaeote CG-Bathy1]|uniref:2-(1,2-epoxy-1,2-dihydrophenyl)acetyl-CoA isomerase n=1 Tax=Marine Group III euryarchaeote CG-Bathy1 TaxID=1889001 RepID=A0A1J5TX51_9ARCH|nr:MAG: hypothetical protein BEU04_01315 [Marine Group III euryarchaeote CG-Bathy1]
MIEIENHGNIRTIILNRSEKLNAINLEMATLIREEVEKADEEDNVKILILTGKGRAFSVGGDVNEMGDYLPKAGDLFYKLTEQLHATVEKIMTMKKPVICGINGIVAGGALGIALAGDLRIGNKSTEMLSAHFKRGFVPAGGATYLLPKIIGLGKTQDLFFGERTINASEMKEMGILHRVVKDEEMLKECMKEARRLERGPLDAIGETKMLLNSQELKMMKEHLVLERESNRESGNTGDAVEGIMAFLEKREGKFNSE